MGKYHLLFLFAIVSAFLFESQSTLAETNQRKDGNETLIWGKNCDEIAFRDLNYVGVPFVAAPGELSCVGFGATVQCPFSVVTDPYDWTIGGPRPPHRNDDRNPFNNLYYCTKTTPANLNSKEYICKSRAYVESKWLKETGKKIKFHWDGATCKCGLWDASGGIIPGSFVTCEQEAPQWSADILATYDRLHNPPAPTPAPAHVETPRENKCHELGLRPINSGTFNSCLCPNDNTRVPRTAAGAASCPQTPAGPTGPTCESLGMSPGYSPDNCYCSVEGESEGCVGECTANDDIPPQAAPQTFPRNEAGKASCLAARNQPAPANNNALREPTPQPTPPASQEPQEDPAVAQRQLQELRSCLSEWQATASLCEESANAAVSACDSEAGSRKTAGSLGAVIDQIKKDYNSGKEGTPAQQECFASSMISSESLDAVQGLIHSCETEVAACNSHCNSSNVNQFQSACSGKIVVPGNEAASTANRAEYEAALSQIRQKIAAGGNTCSTRAAAKKSNLDNVAKNLGSALSDSVRCTCQLSAGGVASPSGVNAGACGTIPTVAQCQANPELPGCQTYPAISVCSPGPSYNEFLCACQVNPSASGCPNDSSVGNLLPFGPDILKKDGLVVNMGRFSGFAGNKTNGSGAGAAGSGGADGFAGGGISGGLKGSGKIGDLNGSNTNDSTNASGIGGLASSSSGSGGALSGASGGGGGGGGGSGGGSNGEPEVTEEDGANSALGGIFSQAKNFVSQAMGLKGGTKASTSKNAKADDKDKNKKDKFDPDRFKPKRSLAEEANMGSKNMDIFKMVNLCANGYSCRSNVDGFITTP